jgi:hypothetical protein
MNGKMRTNAIIRWTARILGSIMVVIGLVLFGSELFQDLPGGETCSIDARARFISVLVLHGAYIIGYLVAWKWEGLGGLIAIIGILFSQMISPDPFSMFLGQLLFTVPGILFLLYWFLTRRQPEA